MARQSLTTLLTLRQRAEKAAYTAAASARQELIDAEQAQRRLEEATQHCGAELAAELAGLANWSPSRAEEGVVEGHHLHRLRGKLNDAKAQAGHHHQETLQSARQRQAYAQLEWQRALQARELVEKQIARRESIRQIGHERQEEEARSDLGLSLHARKPR